MNPMALQESDLKMMLAANVHVGSKNIDSNMERYVWRRKVDGVYLINLGKTWEKLMLAARAIVAIENPLDVIAVSTRTYGQRAVFKYAQHTGANTITGNRFTPGTFTNQKQRYYVEPRLLIVTEPFTDAQPILEASYVGIPIIAFADTDASLVHVDIAIPCNNKSINSIALMYWFLAREVLRLRAMISRAEPWSIMVDLFMYRDPEEAEKNAKLQEQLAIQNQYAETTTAAAAAPEQTQQTQQTQQVQQQQEWTQQAQPQQQQAQQQQYNQANWQQYAPNDAPQQQQILGGQQQWDGQ